MAHSTLQYQNIMLDMTCADSLDAGKEQDEVYYVYMPLLRLYSPLCIYMILYTVF